MASNISKRIQAARENPIDVYGDVLNNPKQRLSQEYTIEALAGEHASINQSQKAQTKENNTKSKAHGEGLKPKKKGKPMSYETEYAHRRSGKKTRFNK